MPRIDAPTVLEHRARQRRALIAAARALLAETGDAPSMSAVGRRAGLARSSVYAYFSSPDDLMRALVAEVFPDWYGRVHDRVASASTPGTRVWAYIEANVELFASSEVAISRALSRVVDPDVLRDPMRHFHAELQVPLRDALSDLGEPEPEAAAGMVDALISHVCRRQQEQDSSPAAHRDNALGLLRRALAGYLKLPPHGDDAGSPTAGTA